MINFFRRIRKGLFGSGQVRKYFFYTIGEVALVVIGILIALQINNWNEKRKDDRREIEFLKGIQNDLQKDSIRIEEIVSFYASHFGIIESIVPGFCTQSIRRMSIRGQDSLEEKLIELILLRVPKDGEKSHMKEYCRREPSIRPTVGTFNALIADGNTQTIKNRSLFNDMQSLYLVQFEAMNSVYESVKKAEDYFNSRHSMQIQNNIYELPREIDDDKFIADLLYSKDHMILYSVLLVRFQNDIHSILRKIRKEL